MDVTDLAERYADLIAVSGSSAFVAPLGGWTARMVVAHLALGDRLLIESLHTGRFDNAPATDRERLQAVPDPVAALAASSAELLGLLAALDAGATRAPIRVRIAEEEGVVVDQSLTVAEVVDLHAGQHLPGHLHQLLGLRVLPWGASGSAMRRFNVPAHELGEADDPTP
ncbi:MAG TPA: maleylpyruvate isomerase N-terminal domain-containing protein [Acidimicrobiales bacterium]|nr:maleylpyruvate isomerase N-terminal domain-containing protein [Acidimicrobiales bacterium]